MNGSYQLESSLMTRDSFGILTFVWSICLFRLCFHLKGREDEGGLIMCVCVWGWQVCNAAQNNVPEAIPVISLSFPPSQSLFSLSPTQSVFLPSRSHIKERSVISAGSCVTYRTLSLRGADLLLVHLSHCRRRFSHIGNKSGTEPVQIWV